MQNNNKRRSKQKGKKRRQKPHDEFLLKYITIKIKMSKVKVLELFSGIGGMHFALEEAKKYLKDFDYKIVRAIDISDNANQVYKHNFPEVDVRGSNICGLTPESLNKLEVDAIFMSPPW